MNTYKQLSAATILRQTDGVYIPTDSANTDYQQFLREKAAGATVIPTDVPSPNVAILAQIAQIETSTAVPRIVREALMRMLERAATQDATPINTSEMILAANIGYGRVKAVDDQIRALRAQLK